MFTERLKALRNGRGLNKAEMARQLKLPYTTYNNYETGAREPASDFLLLVSKEFRVSVDFLLGNPYEKENTPTEPAGVRSHLIDKIMTDFMTLSEEDMHQVLDFVEFLISKRSS